MMRLPFGDGRIARTSALGFGDQGRTVPVVDETAASRTRRAPLTLVKLPPMRTRWPIGAIAKTVLSGFGAHASGVAAPPDVVVTGYATRFLRATPPAVANAPPT